MDTQIVTAILAVFTVTFAYYAIRIGRVLLHKPHIFVFRGQERRNNTYPNPGSKHSELIPGQSVHGHTQFEGLRRFFDFSKSLQDRVLDSHRAYGTTFVGGQFGQETLLTADVELVRKIMISSVDSFAKADGDNLSYRLEKIIGGESVLMVNGHKWENQRKQLNPAFYSLDRYLPIFKQTSQDLFDVFDKEIKSCRGQAEVEVHDLLSRLTLDVLGRAVFFHEFNALKANDSKELNAYLYCWGNSISLPDILFNWWHKVPTGSNTRFDKEIALLKTAFNDLIAKSKAKIQRMEETHQADTNLNILDQMVQSELTQKELLDNTGILFIAGHETSANTLSFALARLATEPKAQQKLFETVCAEIGEEGLLDSAKLGNCMYLDYFIKEVLRMNGPLTRLPVRKVLKEEIIGDIVCPKDSRVNISVSAVHYSEAYWKQPYEFRPERFGPEESKGRPSIAFMPFGAGRRLCMGQQFAMLEMKCFLASLVMKYKLEPAVGCEKVRAKPSLNVQQVAEGFKVKLVPRQ